MDASYVEMVVVASVVLILGVIYLKPIVKKLTGEDLRKAETAEQDAARLMILLLAAYVLQTSGWQSQPVTTKKNGAVD